MDALRDLLTHPGVLVALIVAPPILLFAWGAYLGTRGAIIVYRNYNDVMIVGMLVLIPLAIFGFMLPFFEIDGRVFELVWPTVMVLMGLLLVFIVVRTAVDNRNVFKTLLALYVKVPAGLLFFIQLTSAFTGEKRKNRRESMMWTLLMLPLLYALVHDKSVGRLPGMQRRRAS